MAEERQIDPQRYACELTIYRQRKDEFLASSPDSPIPDEEQGERFGGLRYYPPDLTYRVEAEVIPFDSPQVVMLGSTKGDIRRQLRYGELRFRMMGAEYRLLAFKDAGDAASTELFVPFRDSTSGGATYGAGRYLEVEQYGASGGSQKVILDFNLAYNPWCAYNVAYSCTLPPPENTLRVPIEAGELTYPTEH